LLLIINLNGDQVEIQLQVLSSDDITSSQRTDFKFYKVKNENEHRTRELRVLLSIEPEISVVHIFIHCM